jgi:two-component system, response regulator PdtaR
MQRPTIIVVEDEPMNRLIAVDVLDEAGFEVFDFGRADDAMDFAEGADQPVAALFTDINVPGDQDGIELAQYFARRWPSTLVLVTSGRFGTLRPTELPPKALYVSKPWRGKDVVQILRSGLEQS